MALDWERLLATYANRVHFQEEDVDYLKMLIRNAVAAEREACAELAERHSYTMDGYLSDEMTNLERAVGKNIARAIRARK